MHRTAPSPCFRHAVALAACPTCAAHRRWTAPAVVEWLGRRTKAKPFTLFPCTRHAEAAAGCPGCQQWAIFEQKAEVQHAGRVRSRLSTRKTTSPKFIVDAVAPGP